MQQIVTGSQATRKGRVRQRAVGVGQQLGCCIRPSRQRVEHPAAPLVDLVEQFDLRSLLRWPRVRRAKLSSPAESALEVLQLFLYVLPLIRVRRVRFKARDRWPFLGKLCIQGDKFLLICRNILLGVDRVDGAFGYANRAIDALIWVDNEEIRPLAKAIDGADIDAIGVLAANARFRNDVGHRQGSGGRR
ncbi:hypothetical protein SBBP2_200002 [Burkholderiales bacterium]|nr:hypothetical protein SBBP2_200002 [Burkholderiales bacterium]